MKIIVPEEWINQMNAIKATRDWSYNTLCSYIGFSVGTIQRINLNKPIGPRMMFKLKKFLEANTEGSEQFAQYLRGIAQHSGQSPAQR